jgi:4-azaleucine resistance transporter AzlC
VIRRVRHVLADARLAPVASASVALGVAVGVFAVAFGVTASASGVTVAQACALSLFTFTGASQFSAVSVIAAGGSPLAAYSGAALLAARNGVYALTLADRLEGSLPKRLVAAQLTIDETTAMAVAQDEPDLQRAAFWITGITLFVCWNIGTLVGALAGQAVDPRTFGLDAALPAAFVGMLWPLLRTRRARMAAGLGALICLALIPVAPVGVPILCAVAAIALGIPDDGARP